MRASTRRWRSFAAWYSAFSRRSPSSRARLISFGSSSFNSWLSVASSSSNFLISRSFMARSNGTTVLCFSTPCPHARRDASAAVVIRTSPGIEPWSGATIRRPAPARRSPSRRRRSGRRPAARERSRPVDGDRTSRDSRADGRTRARRRGGCGDHGSGDGGGQPCPIVERDRRHRRGQPPMQAACTPVWRPLVLIAHDVQDPGNLGAIVRAAEAGQATSVIAAGACADPFGWKALRGSPAARCACRSAPPRRRRGYCRSATPRLPRDRHRPARGALACMTSTCAAPRPS